MQEAVVVKLRLKNSALKVQKRKLLMQLRQVCNYTCCIRQLWNKLLQQHWNVATILIIIKLIN